MAPARAGLYNTAEPPIPLDPNVEKFLDKLKQLRSYAPPDGRIMLQESEGRKDYLKKVETLRQKQKSGRLTAEELANLGAYLIRLRTTRPFALDMQEALDVLQAAAEQYPRDFYIQANLGTVHQLMNNFDLASRTLEMAEGLATTAELRSMEHYHWLLVSRRAAERAGPPPLDRLFPIRFVGESGKWEMLKISPAELAKLPGGSVKEAKRIVQQLLIWLPTDNRLHWLLGELANAEGDLRGAYAAMDAAVTSFNLSTPELKEHRALLKEEVERRNEQAASNVPDIFAEPPAAPAGNALMDLTWRGWLLVAIFAALILGLLMLQAREMIRRRKLNNKRSAISNPIADR
jgi:tetratricopeptide (TPR) repeat protein